jgi:hypothetical protein
MGINVILTEIMSAHSAIDGILGPYATLELAVRLDNQSIRLLRLNTFSILKILNISNCLRGSGSAKMLGCVLMA